MQFCFSASRSCRRPTVQYLALPAGNRLSPARRAKVTTMWHVNASSIWTRLLTTNKLGYLLIRLIMVWFCTQVSALLTILIQIRFFQVSQAEGGRFKNIANDPQMLLWHLNRFSSFTQFTLTSSHSPTSPVYRTHIWHFTSGSVGAICEIE